jgi:TRAP-type mannitol/chloroaromatic compound transport system permease small subunit
MPELGFVLPHWLYWSGLLLFPLLAGYLVRRARRREQTQPLSLGLGYFLLLTGGFIGVHRLYLKSRWAIAFMILFVAVLEVNVEARVARDLLSGASNAVRIGESRIDRTERKIDKALRRIERRDTERARETLAEARADLEQAQKRLLEVREELVTAEVRANRWAGMARSLGILLFLGILLDALLLPRLIGRRNALEKGLPGEGFHCPVVEKEHDDSSEPFLFNRWVSRLNGFAGEFVAYWSIIAVFVYYYEVIARYVFNSPTNWAHEAMFLMFGMQYLIAGGFCMRENAHVRVDVIYTHLSRRTQAILDLVTSVFFFIFVVTLLVTGWIFFHDAYRVGEVSFTEWAIQYWPVKFALPLGAALLLLQGIAQLAKDVAAVIGPDAVDLDSRIRPEG